MSTHVKLCLVAFFLLSIVSVRAAEDNPLVKAKVGDWVQYKATTSMAGQKMEMEQKHEVVAKTDVDITLEYSMIMNGKVMNKSRHTFKLNEKFDPNTMDMKDVNAKVKQLGTGQEAVTVGGNTYQATWTATEITADMGGQEMTIKSKAWVSPEVPLHGLLKTHSEMPMGVMEMELTGSGKGK
jgi:hypothetical protein